MRCNTTQQHHFDAFCQSYNTARPHEALGLTPASCDAPSPRPYPSRPPVEEYAGRFPLKTTSTGGTFRFSKRLQYRANARTDQRIGLKESDDCLWSIYFHTVQLVTLDERDCII